MSIERMIEKPTRRMLYVVTAALAVGIAYFIGSSTTTESKTVSLDSLDELIGAQKVCADYTSNGDDGGDDGDGDSGGGDSCGF